MRGLLFPHPLIKGNSYDLRLRTWHCSSTLRVNLKPLLELEGLIGGKMKLKLIISIAIVFVLMTSCGSGKIVLSHDTNIDKYKYVIFGDEVSGDNELDDILMEVRNLIANCNLKILSASDAFEISQCSGSILSPNIHISTEKWEGGHTYITVKFVDYETEQSIAIVKSSGIGLSISQDQNIALKAMKKELKKLFKQH